MARGDIVDADVVAPIELQVADPEATESRRAEVRTRVVDVYDFDPVRMADTSGVAERALRLGPGRTGRR